MSGFYEATICADCDPPVVAISTGHGSRCPRCGQVETRSLLTTHTLDDGVLARQVIRDTAIRSDGDARLLAELAGRLLEHAGKKEHVKELAKLRDLADLVSDADISALPPELRAVRQQWLADRHAKEVTETSRADWMCPHCLAGEPSVWDDVLSHYAHPDGGKLKMCHDPWRVRCRRCSADIADVGGEFCAKHAEVP